MTSAFEQFEGNEPESLDNSRTSQPTHVGPFRFHEDPKILYLLFLVFVCAKYMQWGDRRDIFAVIRFEFLLGIILTLASIWLLTNVKRSFQPGRNILIGAGLLTMAMVIQLPFAADPVRAEAIFVDRVVKSILLAFFIAVMVRSPKYLRWFISVFLFSCFYVTQESVRGLISGSLVWQNQGVMRLHGTVSLYAHPNSLAGLAMGCIPFCVFLIPVVKSKLAKLALLALLTTSLTCVVYSGSRTSYVALCFFLLFWWVTSSKKLAGLGFAVVGGLAAIRILPQEYIGRFLSIGSTGSSVGGSNDTRIQILRDAWDIFLAHPLGVGVASFPAVRLATFGRMQDTHNLYLEIATNLGIQGLLIFIFFISVLFLSLWRTYKRVNLVRAMLRALSHPLHVKTQLADLGYVQAVAKATACFIFVRLALGLFGMDLFEVYWWFATGVAIALASIVATMEIQARRLVVKTRREL